jgi:uncharacterized secreted protein with C-terminal beta-propeller domain
MMVAMVSCGDTTVNKQSTNQSNRPTKEVIHVIADYRFEGDYVSKIMIDGHEYLVFSSRVTHPPTVIHNMACPCMETK